MLVTIPGIERIYGLVFAYEDASDPHVVYVTSVNQANGVPKGLALRVLRGSG
jgi:hypothetical protein